VMATVAAYGVNTLDKVRDAAVDGASDATVRVGHRILNRILGREDSRAAIEGAISDLAAGEADSAAALRLQIRKALASDAGLARELAATLPASAQTRFIGAQYNLGPGTFIGGDNHGDINPPRMDF